MDEPLTRDAEFSCTSWPPSIRRGGAQTGARDSKAPLPALEERWLEGIFVGMQGNRDEVFFLNERGFFTARSVKRLEVGSRHNKDLLAKCTARLWDRLVRSDPRAVSIRDARDCSSAIRGGCARHPEALFHQESQTLQRTATPKKRPGCNAARMDAAARIHTGARRERLTTLTTTRSEDGMERGLEAER